MPDHFHGIVMIHENESAARSGVIPFVDWDGAMVVGSLRRPAARMANGRPVETDCYPSPHCCSSPHDDGGRPSIEPVPKWPAQNQFGPQRNNLPSIIRGFKSACTTRIHTAGYPVFRWQSLYWDRIVRNQDELNRIRHILPIIHASGANVTDNSPLTIPPMPIPPQSTPH